jgi:hypothetical protein
LDIETERQGLKDPMAWKQEYELNWLWLSE